MCGIVGNTGKQNVIPMLLDGLKRLEYRGYDSVGIAFTEDSGRIRIVKRKGRVASIEPDIVGLYGRTSIGHTRWATHGKPSDSNSHPHRAGKFAIVHNGIIENYLDLKVELVNDGQPFLSDTDTEVIAHLLSRYYRGNLLEALRKTVERLVGSFALAVLCEDYPDCIAVTKKDNPLILGKSADGNYLASDANALAGYAQELYVMQDYEFALLSPTEISLSDRKGKPIERSFIATDLVKESMDLGSFESFMTKEIHEIPDALTRTFEYLFSQPINVEALARLRKASSVTVIACGTAYHAGVCGKLIIEKQCRIPVSVDIASEYRYRDPIVAPNSVVIAVSQSGETADTLAAVRLAKERGAYILCITNVERSTLTTYSDTVLHTKAGPEIGVAATKSYNTQLAAFYCLAYLMSGKYTAEQRDKFLALSEKARQIIADNDSMIELARTFNDVHNVFFLGRSLDYAVALEGSLKLKEISYIHSEGCPAGELKHGTLALIEKNTLVVAIITQRALAEKTMNAVHEVQSRDARVLVITQFADIARLQGVDYSVLLPQADDELMPMLSIIPLQEFAYYAARARGNDPDKPRNLAKSVTVE